MKENPWFDGKPNESLFHRPFISFFRDNPLPELFQKLEGIDDDRLLAIVTAMVVEDRLDNLLAGFLPRYNKLTDYEQYTFSMKIHLLEALNLVPIHITNMADCLRQIRNEFAHNLDKTTFEELPEKIQNRLIGIRDEVCRHSDGPAPSLEHAFNNLRFFCTVSLDMYSVNIENLRESISDSTFLEQLEQKILQKSEAQLKEITSKPPISIEKTGNTTVTKYEGGVTDVQIHDSGEIKL